MIEILGKKYKIVETNHECMPDNFGTSSTRDQIITLTKSMSSQQRGDTLLHEIIHIISGELVLGMSEETITRLAVGLYSAGVRVKE